MKIRMKSEIGSPTALAAAAGDTTTNGADATVGATRAPEPTDAAGRTTGAEPSVSRRATAAADHATASEAPPLRDPNHDEIGDATGGTVGATDIDGACTGTATASPAPGVSTASSADRSRDVTRSSAVSWAASPPRPDEARGGSTGASAPD